MMASNISEKKIKNKVREMNIRHPKHKANLQGEINKLARLIDAKFDYKCIDCGGEMDAQPNGSHFHNIGSHNSLRYNLHNVHRSRSDCNKHFGGRKDGYKAGLVSRYGQEYLDAVEGLKLRYPEIKLTAQEIYEKLAIVRKLNRDIGTMTFKDGAQAREILNKVIGIYT
jgi:hypothetical protein